MGRKPFYVKGMLGNRPNARRLGLFYHDAGDNTIYVDDGSEWAEAGGGAAPVPGPKLLSYNVFVPGTLRPLTVATLNNPAINSESALASLEANLQSAPVGVDASNHIIARIAAGGMVQDLPLNAAVSRFVWPPVTQQGGMGTSSSFTSSNTARGMALAFTVNTPTRVTQFDFNLESSMAAARRLLGLLDADCNWLGYVETTSDITTKTRYTLPEPVLLETGTRYHFGLMAPDGGRAYARRSSGTGFGVVHYSTDVNTDYGVFVHNTAPAGITLADANASGQRNISWSDGSSPTYGRTNSLLPNFALYGTPELPILSGDITLSLIGVGTIPPDPGADLNLTMRLEA